ncbi:nucleoporin NUP42 [Scleropages formosus]|uniref:nucleoporin NUP42 n=1 Tax=Scleropages formosus TaxID=113540 RepID=UPI000878A8C3|nr:nucleoporin-like protein 2 [Scleropages formosus]
MTVCSFFLQGRCRYGEKCWNEHPQGGSGGSYSNTNRVPQQQSGGGGQRGGGGGFGNRVWVNPSQRSSNRDYVAPSSFSRGGNDWGRGGGGSRDFKSSNFTFTIENRFSALDTHQTTDRGLQDDNNKNLETVHKDMEIWETSGQWLFSCYSILKASIPGFPEYSPEELRMEYYKCRETGNLQTYANSVQQLISQWRSRVQELKNLNSTSLAKLITELNSQGTPSSVGFGSIASAFGKGGFSGTESNAFSFAPSSSGFGSTSTPGAPTGFGSLGSTQPAPLFGSSASTSSSASSSSDPSAATFSFAVPVANKEQVTGFGSTSVAGFSFTSAGFGNSFTSAPTAGASPGQGSSVFGGSSTVTGTGSGMVAAGAASSGSPADKLFTPQSELTPEELKEFMGKRFTLGQIPLKPPPADLLVV